MDDEKNRAEDWLNNRLNEAKVYHSMGLYDAARDIYERVLEKNLDLPEHIRTRIQRMIAEMAENEPEDPHENGAGDPSLPDTGATIAKEEDILEESDIPLKIAMAFMQNERYREALDELRKLFGTSTPVEKVLDHIVDCVVGEYGLSEAPARIDALAEGDMLGRREKAQLKFQLGVKLEELGHISPALEMYRSTRGTVPEDLEMGAALDRKIAALSKDSPHAYLLNQGWVSEGDLETAGEKALLENRSVESILVNEVGISKDKAGESLSIFYGVPFREFDEVLPVAPGDFPGLERQALVRGGWAPLARYSDSADVLMTNPAVPGVLEKIQSALKIKKVHVFVGIKEDVDKTIEMYFKKAEPLVAMEDTRAPAPDPKADREVRKSKRFEPLIPAFAYAEFYFEDGKGRKKPYSLEVLNSSEHGIGLLLHGENLELVDRLARGMVLRDMTFYAEWALIHVDGVVRHITPIQKGKHKGGYLVGIASEEIVESSKISS